MASPLEVELLLGSVGDPPALDVALAAALLDAVARGEHGPVLRCYRPRSTVAFGRRDTLLPGFAAAARVALQHGFAPVIRAPGGRAAAYGGGCLVIDQIMPDAAALTGIRDRFACEAERQAQALRRLGVDARVGEVPGEYCPGAFTVNARAQTKLIGSAQRVLRGGWLLSTVAVVESASRVRSVLEGVYGALELDWNPDTVGAVADEAPGLTVDDVKRVLLDGYADQYHLLPATIPESALTAARERIARHLPG
jgi:octanoyl-[GcvH]:protein N-octanoyltransferase